jgi:hypothetical protein
MRTLFDYANEQQESDNDEAKAGEESSSADLEAERQIILNGVSAGRRNTLRERVALILNLHPQTRDSDIALQIKYWEIFERHIYNGQFVTPDDLYKLTKLTSIARARAEIQNTFKLFVASPEIGYRRRQLAKDEKEKAVENKPDYPTFVVYIDESGKTSDYLLVGSVWLLIPSELLVINEEINRYLEGVNYKKEFHFSEMKNQDLTVYKGFAQVFFQHARSYSFKLISVPRSGISNMEDAIDELYYQLLVRGIEHEDKTRRAPLPRLLTVWKDPEQLGSDKLRLAKLQDKLNQAAKTTFEERLTVGELKPVSAEKNWVLQLTDLYVASANRILSRAGGTRNYKDDFAGFLFSQVKQETPFSFNQKLGDMMVHISL